MHELRRYSGAGLMGLNRAKGQGGIREHAQVSGFQTRALRVPLTELGKVEGLCPYQLHRTYKILQDLET